MKKYFWIIIVIILLVVAVVFLIPSKQNPTTNSVVKTSTSTPKETLQVTPAETKEVVKDFPAGFPIEAGATSDSGFTYVPANTLSKQSSVIYTSNKTLAENGKIFKDYMDVMGYKIINKVETSQNLFYYGTKDNASLSILIEKQDKNVKITATYLIN
ncbi:MAG TPA: hypothetical protein VE973_03105 [Candidatus Limnocylindria bacterium]|nr:hypothetical protein [Candidatus Limnocylindria bacterium]